jgi:hypothetical protein
MRCGRFILFHSFPQTLIPSKAASTSDFLNPGSSSPVSTRVSFSFNSKSQTENSPSEYSNTMIAMWHGVIGIKETLIAGEENQNLIFPVDLTKKLEQLLTNTTLSMNYPVNSPLAKGMAPIVQRFTDVNATSYPAVYTYSPTTFKWEAYAAGLVLCTICIILGSNLLFGNGVSAQMTFSQVLATTRGDLTLDRLSENAYLGGDNIAKELKKTRLRYGKLLSDGHPGFGLEPSQTQSVLTTPRRPWSIPLRGINDPTSTVPLRDRNDGVSS